MKQAFVPKPGKIVYREIEPPALRPGCVVIRVARIGICGSDIHTFRGRHPLVSFPLVQGHEFSGYIEDRAPDVRGFSKGDLVTVQPAMGCGICDKCGKGLFAQCDELKFIGGSLPGAGSELFLAPARQVVKMPAGISADEASMIEPLAVAVHAVGKCNDIKRKRVLVVGGGTIGNLVAQTARACGAGDIVLLERHGLRLEIARSLGLAAYAPPSPPGAEKQIRGFLGGQKPQIAFECVGGVGSLNTCIESVERGGRVVILGVYEKPAPASFLSVQDRELHLVGSLMYTWEDYRTAVKLLQKKRIDVKRLQTHHFPFEEWRDAYALLVKSPHETMKVVIDLHDGIH